MSDLLNRLKKSSTSKLTSQLNKSEFFNDKDITRTSVPMMNIALSGSIRGGLTSGLTVFAGPSKHFKSNMSLLLVSAYMKKHKDAICLFYDSEFGVTPAYLESMGVDPSRVLHTPILNISQLKVDMANQLEEVKRGDKVVVFIDSIGNLASKKEQDDAQNEKIVADMSRARDIKSLFRVVTPHFALKNIPCIAVNHTYMSMEMFAKENMSGGQGPMLSADTVFFISKSQEKGTDKELEGYTFKLKAHKSRYVIENSIFPITVRFNGGIDPYSGLLEMALKIGFVVAAKRGFYSRVFMVDGEMQQESKVWRAKATNCMEFWTDLFKHEPFHTAVTNRYLLGAMDSDAVLESEVDDLIGSEFSSDINVDFDKSTQNAADIEDELDDLDE